MPAETGPVLELADLTKIYRTKGNIMGKGAKEVVALNHINLAIDRGEIFGLVGESGSGKTTCGRLVVGLEKPSLGEIALEGKSILGLKGREHKKYRRKVQMVFQDPYQSLNPQITILDSVMEPLITHGVGQGQEKLEMVVDSLEKAGLSPAEDYIHRFPHQLSGGQRQRVAIARAMVLGPHLLVADEPTSMLDASYSAQIFEILLGVREQYRTTVVFITHSLAAARYLCDRIGVIYRGNLMELGSAAEVINSPMHPYTRALIDATPKLGDQGRTPSYGTLLAKSRQTSPPKEGCPFYHRCALAQDVCPKQKPIWETLENGRGVYCHLLSGAKAGA